VPSKNSPLAVNVTDSPAKTAVLSAETVSLYGGFTKSRTSKKVEASVVSP
jgi:hypothetical protein